MPFTHSTRLEHLLRPYHYASEEHYRVELEKIFLPAWHPVAAKAEVATPGSFMTFEFFDTPIILRNFDGELRAFLNVCAHRNSMLTTQPKGWSEHLICQYHGWEYGADGRTRTIPDAKAFRPWERENSCLHQFHVDTCGDLIFINLSEDPVSLRQWLDPVWQEWLTHGGAYRFAGSWEQDFDVNWKVVLENSLESYHVAKVHTKTFKNYPEEANAWHELTDRFSSYKTVAADNIGIRVMNWVVRYMGHPVTDEYWNRVLHPHAAGSTMDVSRVLTCVFPTGPKSCRYRSILFTLRGERRGFLPEMFHRIITSCTMAFGRQVGLEDASVYPGIQRGIEASRHRGVIGNREERIYYFQKYVLDNCYGAEERDAIGVVDGRHRWRG